MAAGLGGGMAVKGACGAMVGAVMILGRERAIIGGHYCSSLKELVKEFMHQFEAKLGDQNCAVLREMHDADCLMIVNETAKILDDVLGK